MLQLIGTGVLLLMELAFSIAPAAPTRSKGARAQLSANYDHRERCPPTTGRRARRYHHRKAHGRRRRDSRRPIKLYSDVNGLWTNIGQMTTSESGGFAFQVQQAPPGTSLFKATYPGDSSYEPSVSAEMVVTYVTTPTAITAAAAPQRQVVGRDVTITGLFTADGTPVADASVTLYNADDVIERVPVATTTTDTESHYQFTVTDAAV